MMDTAVPFGVGGFPMLTGGRYRLVASIPNAAFQVLPWNAPSPADIAGSLEAAGFRDVVLVLPWEERPHDWPGDSTDGDAFVVRASSMWAGRDGLAAHVPLKGSEHAITIVQVWLHAAPPTPAPQPLPPPIAPTPGPAPTSAPQRQQPAGPPAPRAVTPEPLPPPKPPKGIGTVAKVALGGGAIAAATLLIAHAPFRRSRTA